MTGAPTTDHDPAAPTSSVGRPTTRGTAVSHPAVDAHTDPDPGGDSSVDGSPQPTGHPAVDEVLASLAGLEERPVAEHVAVFEAAHDRLRAALAEAGDPAAPPSGG